MKIFLLTLTFFSLEQVVATEYFPQIAANVASQTNNNQNPPVEAVPERPKPSSAKKSFKPRTNSIQKNLWPNHQDSENE